MTVEKLRLGALADDKPVGLTVILPPALWEDLVEYGEVLGRQTNQTGAPAKLVPPMLGRFMVTDRAFARARKQRTG